MSTVGIDHLAMPTANAERLITFYKGLGFTINDEAEWRAGTASRRTQPGNPERPRISERRYRALCRRSGDIARAMHDKIPPPAARGQAALRSSG